MSDRQPRQVQCKLGEADADGNWRLGSPAPASATDDKTQTVTGYKRRGPRQLPPHPSVPARSAGSGGGRRVGQRLVAVSDDELINEFWVVFLEPMLEPISIKY